MRTVKASEVVKGMRVRVEQRFTHPPLIKGGAEDETIETIEGTVATEWEVWGEHDRNIDQPLVVADLILGGTQ